MKLGLAIASEKALPSAFVVFRDELAKSIRKVAELGYDGVELALLDSSQVSLPEIKALLRQYRLELPVISTGQVFAEAKLWLTHPDAEIRRRTVDRLKSLIDLAGEFGAMVNVGRVRGPLDPLDPNASEERFLTGIRECGEHGRRRGVRILLEPVNRYEINFINSVLDGLEVLKKIDDPQIFLMPDVFHMNIEDASISRSLKAAKDSIAYVHFADSNRWAPGDGHLDFADIVGTLKAIGYDGFVTLEILPCPDPDTAASRGISYVRKLI
ncbi:MAG TPA: sugar phosphate isomerase/epimerase family protein [Chloroflexota bacterium]